jgi:hypothetical protein
MGDEELTKFLDGVQEKLGKENSALIADDLGVLISSNAETQKSLRHKDEQIEKLRERNEKLILANGNLLKQMPVEHSEPAYREEEEKPKKRINLNDAFDAQGRFIH